MKIILIMICGFSILSFGKSYSQNVKLTLDFENESVENVLQYIEEQSDFSFMYDNNKVDVSRKVNIKVKDEPISSILSQLFENDINYQLVGNHIIITSSDSNSKGDISQAQKTVTGKITDSSGSPLPGVTIVIKGTSSGVISDPNGNYSLSGIPANAILVYSFVGMKTQEIAVGSKSAINIVMAEEAIGIEEVVAVGYGTQKKATLTGAVSSVSSEDLVVTKNENVVNMLTGKLPGVRVVQKSSAPGAYDTTIDIRGMGSPLFVVDGITRDQAYFARMNPEEIESVSVLKDGSAAIYGLRAANGVMLITTKSGASQNGKVDITYNGSYTLQEFLYVPEGVSAQDYMTLRNESNWQNFSNNYLVRRDPIFTQDQMQPYIDGTKQSYNWMDAVFNKTTPQQQHNLSINGGNEKLRYFLSLAYGQQEGTYKSGDYNANRWNFRSNVDAQITNRLKARVSIGAILNETNQPNGTGWSTYKSAWLLRPDAPIYANDNPAYLNGDSGLLYDGHNMVAEVDADYVGYNISKQRRLNGTLQLTYDIPGVKGLSAKGSYDYALSLPDNTSYRSTYSLYVYNPGTGVYAPSIKNSPSSIQRSVNFNYDTDMQLGLYYNNRFGNHNVNSFLIFEEAYSTWDSFTAYRELMIDSEYLFAGEDKNQ